MRLKLDLHPIYNDSQRIEEALQSIIEEAITKRATEVEIIPGKGSGALKKSVIRFLDRPEIKSQYHRLEKDGDNWGRLFVHFRHNRPDPTVKPKPAAAGPVLEVACAGCGDPITVSVPEEDAGDALSVACPWCGSPNRLTFRRDRRGTLQARAELDYSAF
ncbi:MAG TPA: Smr/MutS family protein [Chthonomonadaceae bacterium]|nr:Smr/MutS family protein [Chthonomonadaceae bacterium]